MKRISARGRISKADSISVQLLAFRFHRSGKGSSRVFRGRSFKFILLARWHPSCFSLRHA